MGMNFPSAPLVGDTYPTPPVAGSPAYKWDGNAWQPLGAVPSNKVPVYTDGSSPMAAQLRLVAPPIAANDAAAKSYVDGAVRWDSAQALTLVQKLQARQNVAAAPFDPMAYLGLQVNGSCEQSQERGNTAFTMAAGVWQYIQDGWEAFFSTAGSLRCSGFPAYTGSLPQGYISSVLLQAQTGQASPVTADRAMLGHPVEALRWAKLAWGTPQAQPVTVAFWLNTQYAGNFGVGIQNYTNPRSCVVDVPVVAGWNYCVATFPADTGGSWSGVNPVIAFCPIGGPSVMTAAPGTWVNGANNYVTSNSGNFFPANGSTLCITGLGIFPGSEAPSAARAPFVQKDFQQTYLECQRYLYRWSSTAFIRLGLAFCDTATTAQMVLSLPVPMRVTPTTTIANIGGSGGTNPFTSGAVQAIYANIAHLAFQSSGLTPGQVIQVYAPASTNGLLQLDARM
ncbi:hypothetical protein NLM33_33110 [Bradyrhizobium sp. CCGUVB1N3]|uniref:hypothetical protein n=1 Tax=Bradyrhizobium sp. CCGUVB1N3 TaxID=2949629 RepID=UPI0020B3F79A|nr:hypothetical protein [Bradyrhizobium sp. CCGUVB1N3]MCP3475165.1 hypothetical protein [Bradyrhizobium sp. CCGUVB1N3]